MKKYRLLFMRLLVIVLALGLGAGAFGCGLGTSGGYLYPPATLTRPALTAPAADQPAYAAAQVALPCVVEVQAGLNGSSSATAGSGVIVGSEAADEAGFFYPHILTNFHVIQGALATATGKIKNNYVIRFRFYGHANYTSVAPVILGFDYRQDIAVVRLPLKMDAAYMQYSTIDVADSNQLEYGEGAVAVGNAQAMGTSVTQGLISIPQVESTFTVKNLDGNELSVAKRVVQTSAPINPGNSGGALVNMSGALVGINTYRLEAEGDRIVEAMGFACPSNVAMAVYHNILSHYNAAAPKDSFAPPYLQSGFAQLTNFAAGPDAKATGGTGLEQPYLVVLATAGSLRTGDRVVEVCGVPLFDEYGTYLFQTAALPTVAPIEQIALYYGASGTGAAFTLTVLRNGERKIISYTNWKQVQKPPFLA
jgi:serine protease Do